MLIWTYFLFWYVGLVLKFVTLYKRLTPAFVLLFCLYEGTVIVNRNITTGRQEDGAYASVGITTFTFV
jgi:hypothetical protein